MVLRAGAFAAMAGERNRIPVTCVSLAMMPRVANGVRTQAWNACTRAPSGMGALSRKHANLFEEVRRHVHALANRTLEVVQPALARQANFRVYGHRGHECFDTLEENVIARERTGIDREKC